MADTKEDFITSALSFINEELSERKKTHRFREILAVDSVDTPYAQVEGKRFLSFASNDYLGLGSMPLALRELQETKPSSTSSRLLGGDSKALREAEKNLESIFNKNECKATLFPSTWQANMSVIPTLVSRNDLICLDKYCHNSLIKAAQLSGAKILRYKHQDLAHLEELLEKNRVSFRRCLLISESVFSMHGSLLNHLKFLEIAKEFSAISMIDEAHSFGVYGEMGRGRSVDSAMPDIYVGALGKAAGAMGGFVISSAKVRSYLENFAAGMIYSTAISPVIAALINAQIDRLKSAESQRSALFKNIKCMQELLSQFGFQFESVFTAIIPIYFNTEQAVISAREHFYDQGILISAVRPPTVPAGQSCIRISLTAKHKEEHLVQFVGLLNQLNPLKYG